MTISFHAEQLVFDLCKQPSYLSSVIFLYYEYIVLYLPSFIFQKLLKFTNWCFKIPWYVHPHIHTGTCSRWCGTTGQCPCRPPVTDQTESGWWWCGGPGRYPGWWGDRAETCRLRFCLSVHVLHPANGFLCIHSGMEIRCFRKKKTLSVIFTTTHQSGDTCRSICNVFV